MKKEIHLTNELSELKQLSNFVVHTALDLGLDDKLCLRLNLALEEAVANVILYAYPGEKDKGVTVQMEEKEGILIVTLIDSGIAFDPTQKEQPDISKSAAERPIGGLGIHLIREIMTTVTYCRQGNENILTMIKNLR